MSITRVLLTVVMLLCLNVHQASAELVINGGFESGDFSGWTLNGDAANNFVTTGFPQSGMYSAYFGELGGLGSLSQTLLTIPKTTYVLSFWFAGDGSSPSQFSASIDGNVLLDLVDPPLQEEYVHYVYTFTANSPETNLEFRFRDDVFYVNLDDVSVSPTTAVPEPTSMIPLGMGLVAVGGYTLGRRGKSEDPASKSD